ncbi:putative bifunctional diguanylate cyclase/phosphodiesterase [Cytobacillus sp. Hz8]|uniref:putative bifunctional diguanylate cyclase/phosphodiesterase n=1 Tax=Cytobacillus sp. Hz8 TaxID=3347168 RepID=UPI0035D6400A
MYHKVPFKIIVLNIFLVFFPIIVEQYNESSTEFIWFLHLIPIYFAIYYLSLSRALVFSILTILLHFSWEFGESIHTSEIQYHDIQIFISTTVMKILAILATNFLTTQIKQKQHNLEEANQQLQLQTKDLEYFAYNDYLTGLPNRYMLNRHLSTEINQRNEQELAVLSLDLDRFKMVNDTKGHGAGDELLQLVSKLLKQLVRPRDIVSRQGGDEFIILLKGSGKRESKQMGQQILNEFSNPFFLSDEELFITPSIGISLYPRDGAKADSLIKNADKAMYLAKEKGKNNFQFYTSKLDSSLEQKMVLEQALRKVIENKELVLYYQPQIELITDEIIGVEALLRWNHPDMGLISPLEFIPLAEETGLIIPIGKWVIETACKQTKKWHEKGFTSLHTSVNVSVRQFNDPYFVNYIIEVLSKTGLEPKYLTIEITESIMNNTKKSLNIINQLKGIGIKISIDDFGTGYSSLSVLNELPIDYLKIDQSFIKDHETNSNKNALVKAIIQMGQNLNFELVAEGIENEKQINILKNYQCGFGQGYFYSPPLSVNKVERLFQEMHLKTNENIIFRVP